MKDRTKDIGAAKKRLVELKVRAATSELGTQENTNLNHEVWREEGRLRSMIVGSFGYTGEEMAQWNGGLAPEIHDALDEHFDDVELDVENRLSELEEAVR